jgi:hypothetical protein
MVLQKTRTESFILDISKTTNGDIKLLEIKSLQCDTGL